ncbi:MAG: hypothetical protein IKU85_06500 [Bacteroidaceae bacterium]|nr:hypothetical protein [Bacteroidaceae bacterium]
MPNGSSFAFAKTQKCKKVLNQFFPIDKRKRIYFAAKIEEGKPKIGAVYCAQMCRKYTPNGEMGHPKWKNGTSQMEKWDIPNGEMGHSKKAVWGIGAWITRWNYKGWLKYGRADSRLCIFVFL